MKRKGRILLFPLSVIYGAVTWIRNFMYNTGVLKGREFSHPVICVGNITAGGTGKTPHCEYLIQLLKQNHRIALLSRGYRRKTRGFQYVSAASYSAETGDEPLQIARKFPDVTVAVDGNRVRGITRILADRPETEAVILDDGFQHRRVIPGLTILLSDYGRLMLNDQMLPYGNLRESVSNMYRADIIVITKTPVNLSPIQRRIIGKEINKAPYQSLFFTSFGYGSPEPVFHGAQSDSVPDLHSRRDERGVVLVTGIANPLPLKEYIETIAAEVIHIQYPDHHRFREDDFGHIRAAADSLPVSEKYIITTEKDAVRIKEFTNLDESLKSLFWYIPVEINFLNDDRKEFDNLIVEYVRKNKRNNRVS